MDTVFDRRSERTRARLLAAFTNLVFAKGFENVSVRDIVVAADVARSTFYEHFSDKEDVLRASMNILFTEIADCVSHDGTRPELLRVLDHLWSNRRLTDAIFSGHARVVLSRNLADLIELRLRRLSSGLRVPSRLAAIAIAEAQLALVESWLRGRAHAAVGQVADWMHRSSRALALALIAHA